MELVTEKQLDYAAITTGEMHKWQERLKGILEVGGPLKGERLSSLKLDVEQSYDMENDIYARRLYDAVFEQMVICNTSEESYLKMVK